MADEIPAANRGVKRWIKVLLAISLALNFLVIGTLGGIALNWKNWKSHHPPRLEMAGGPLTRALTRDDRRMIGRQMRKAYRNGGKPHADIKAELEALVSDLKADPYNSKNVKKRLDRQRGVFHERFELGQSLLLERLSQMQPEERSAYADRLLKQLQKRGGHEGNHDKEKRQSN